MKWLRALALVLLLPAAARSATTGGAAVFGAVQVKCGMCHLDRLQTAIGEGEVNFAQLKAGLAGDEDICYSCHNGLVRDTRAKLWAGFQHPAGVRPRDPDAVRASGFPLDERGRLSCGSCHTPHIKNTGVGFFMRFGDDGGTFCRRCHPTYAAGSRFGEHPLARVQSGTTVRLGDGERIVCGTCHRIHGAFSSFLLTRNPWGSEGLCQTCHGANPQRAGAGPGTASHPVNVKPPGASAMEWSRDRISISPSGTVDCWSCHRAHNTPEDSHLVVKELYRGNGCGRCHENQSSFVSQKGNHPVATLGPRDTAPAQGKATCLSCHRAHNSYTKQKGLLVYDVTRPNFCWKCHQEYVGVNRNHPLETLKGGEHVNKLEALGATFGPGRTIICTTCHRVHGSLRDTRGLLAEGKILCLYCHLGENPLDTVTARPGTHPVMVGAGGKVPLEIVVAGGRLGPRGEILCLTCHRVHGSGSPGTGLVPAGGGFRCVLCHRDYEKMSGGVHARALAGSGPTRNGKAAAPGEVCRACHAGHGWAVKLAEGKEDPASRVCLSCHGPGGRAADRAPLDISHPLGVKLPPERGVTPDLPLYLADGRRFRKGAVSCLTCHDVHADDGGESRFFLRAPQAGEGDLCSRCHPDRLAVAGTKHDLRLTAPQEINVAGKTAEQGGLCSPCHRAHGGFDRTMWARFPGASSAAGEQLCLSCHAAGLPAAARVPGPFSHPLRPAPEAGPAGAKPPGAQAGVTCATCHDPHRWNPRQAEDRGGPGSEGGPGSSFLRWADDGESSLCRRCHARQAAMAGGAHDLSRRPPESNCETGQGPPSLCGACHLVHKGAAPFGSPSPIEARGDVVSALCENCHWEGGCASRLLPGEYSHPVGVRGESVEKSQLPLFDSQGRRIRNGMVSCATCHDPHLGRPAPADTPAEGVAGPASLLRMPADQHSPLCVECHRSQALVIGTDHDLRVTAPASRSLDGRTPRESGVCGTCHAAHGGTSSFFLWNQALGPGTDLATNACTGCHNDGTIGIKPGRFEVHYKSEWGKDIAAPRVTMAMKRNVKSETPELMLYSEGGEEGTRGIITCLTCHEPHRWDPGDEAPGDGKPADGDLGTSFLRLKGSFAIKNSFCADCHPHDAVKKFQTFHTVPEP